MRMTLFLFSVLSVFSSFSQEKFIGLNVINGSDHYSVIAETPKRILLSYPGYDVIVKENDNRLGQTITVCDKKYSSGDTIISIKFGRH